MRPGKMASAPIESMIVEDKSEPEKPVDREKVSFHLWYFEINYSICEGQYSFSLITAKAGISK